MVSQFITVAMVVASVTLASASHLTVPTGTSQQYRSQDNLGQYAFGYDESGATGGTFRHEKSDAAGNRIGSYGLRGADGRVRIVNYVADANGYRASVQTNEPGTESRDTGSVAMNRPVELAVAPVAIAEPIVEQVPVAAPVAGPAVAAPVAAPIALEAPQPLPAPAYAQYPALAAPVQGPIQYGPLGSPFQPLIVASPAGYGFTVVSQHPAY